MSAETAASNPWPLRGFAAGLFIVCLVGADPSPTRAGGPGT